MLQNKPILFHEQLIFSLSSLANYLRLPINELRATNMFACLPVDGDESDVEPGGEQDGGAEVGVQLTEALCVHPASVHVGVDVERHDGRVEDEVGQGQGRDERVVRAVQAATPDDQQQNLPVAQDADDDEEDEEMGADPAHQVARIALHAGCR